MVEAYLSKVAEPTASAMEASPILHSLRGVLEKADIDEYRKHLAAKYR